MAESAERTNSLSLPALLVPIAFLASAAALAAQRSSALNTSETAFLGLMVSVVLTSLAFMDRSPHRLLSSVALLCALALWTLPATALRGSTISLVLTTGLFLALIRSRPDQVRAFERGFLVALAIASQALFRPELWLGSARPSNLTSEAILLPAVAGLGAFELGKRGESSLLALAVVVALQRGIGPPLALGLALYCLVSSGLGRRRSTFLWAAISTTILLFWSSQMGSMVAWRGHSSEVIAAMSWLPLLAPAALGLKSERALKFVAAVLLFFAGLWLLAPESALMLALPLLFDKLHSNQVSWHLQRTWSLSLVLGAVLAAGYPWLRPRPVEAVLALFGLQVAWPGALLVTVVFWASVAAIRYGARARSGPPALRWSTWVATSLFGIGLMVQFLPGYDHVLDQPVILTASDSTRTLPVREVVRSVVVDSYASNASQVPLGTPLAELRLRRADGSHYSYQLRAGLEIGEWAARRPNIQAHAPPAWLSWPAADGAYFAQSYRARLSLDLPLTTTSLELRRPEDLPKELQITFLHVGIEP